MENSANAATPANPAAGRAFLWSGLMLVVLGPILLFVQIGLLQRMGTPWYVPILMTLAAAHLLLALRRRATMTRIFLFVLVAGLAGLEWYFFGALLNLPEYQGPVQVGQRMPAFQTTLADGKTLADQDLADGQRRLLIFFRGRW